MTYRDEVSFDKRLEHANRMMSRHPGRVPLILEQARFSQLPKLDKSKYLVPGVLTFGQFLFFIRARLSLPPDIALFVFTIDGKALTNTQTMAEVYENNKHEDNLLHLLYTQESCYGKNVN